MDIAPKTKKAMSKDEVALLLDLIQRNPIITSKETNAAANKLKEDCWALLTITFNAKSGQTPRKLEQLKMKWDNLKKGARRRAANRINNLKSAGEKPKFVTPDEILDKVAGVLASTCGFDVPFCGDGILERDPDNAAKKKKIDSGGSFQEKQAKHVYGMIPMSESLQSKAKTNNRILQDGRLQRNLAIARYFDKKSEKIDLEIKILKLEFANKENNCNNSV